MFHPVLKPDLHASKRQEASKLCLCTTTSKTLSSSSLCAMTPENAVKLDLRAIARQDVFDTVRVRL